MLGIIMAKSSIDLEKISEEELLGTRICDLPITISGTWLDACIQQLYKELDDKGIGFKPLFYLADEWLTPDQEPIIGIPFFLAHPTLMKLENKMILEVEGGTRQWCMMLLRHEAGHAINYAYRLYKRRKWQKIFGLFSREYEERYRFRPYSKSYVRHLEDYYAQYHPDEDFAETFAVWLSPNLDWAERYKGWQAMRKLRYVDEVINEIRDKPAVKENGKKFWEARKIRKTLRNYYKAKYKQWEEDYPDFHDANLKRIFVISEEKYKRGSKNLYAADVIRRYRKDILVSVSRWTGEKRYIINGLIKTLLERCRDLNLIAVESEPTTVLRMSAYITTLVMNYIYTGRFKGKHEKKT
jgi:hypothetical protein